MNGIYLTQQSKQEIEAKIAELEKPVFYWDGIYVNENSEGRIEVYKDLLESAIILPDEESLEDVRNHQTECSIGVIIQPKK